MATQVEQLPVLTKQSSFSESSHWHVLLAAWLGLMFDGMDATIFLLVLFPALSELLGTTSHATVGSYGGVILAAFMTGWAVGAIGFGILSDYIGRTRAMILTILLYAICTGLCAYSHSWVDVAVYRFLVGCGIGGEQSTGIVLIAESWRGKARLHATGIMTTAFGCGYLVAGLLNMYLGHLGWRWLFVAGIVPALLTVYIRSKLKDPLQFQLVQEYKLRLRDKHQDSGFLLPIKQLFSNGNQTNVLVVSALASTAIVGYWAIMAWIPPWINQLTGTLAIPERTTATLIMNVGSIVSGLITGALIISCGRRNAFRIAFVGALLCFLGMFLTVKSFGPSLLAWTFAVGFFAQLPFQCVFIYAPELFDATIRGTAVGFSVQTGRLLGALAALIGGQLISLSGGSYAIAGSCVAMFYFVGIIASFFMPRTDGEVTVSPAILLENEQQRLYTQRV